MKHQGKHSYRAFILAVLALLAAVGVSYAAYSLSGYKKGVIRAAKTEALFSSDVLSNSDSYSKSVVFTGDTIQLSQTFHVYNHALGSATANPENITYTIRFKLEGTCSGTVTVSGSDITEKNLTENEQMVTYDREMSGGSIFDHDYKITFSLQEDDNYWVQVTLTPTAGTGVEPLYCRFNPTRSTAAAAVSTGVTGNFTDAGTPGLTPKDCVAFNYQLSMTNFVGTRTLSWVPTYLELDTYANTNIDGLTVTLDSQNHTITFIATQEQTMDIDLVFYRKAPPQPEPDGWDTWDVTWDDVSEKVWLSED